MVTCFVEGGHFFAFIAGWMDVKTASSWHICVLWLCELAGLTIPRHQYQECLLAVVFPAGSYLPPSCRRRDVLSTAAAFCRADGHQIKLSSSAFHFLSSEMTLPVHVPFNTILL